MRDLDPIMLEERINKLEKNVTPPTPPVPTSNFKKIHNNFNFVNGRCNLIDNDIKNSSIVLVQNSYEGTSSITFSTYNITNGSIYISALSNGSGQPINGEMTLDVIIFN